MSGNCCRKNRLRSFEIKDNVLVGPKLQLDTHGQHIGQMIYKKFNENPEHTGQIDVDLRSRTTNAQMLDQSVRVALWLKKQGIGRGDIVALSSANHLKVFIPVVSSLFVAAAFNPWPSELSTKSARHMMQLIRPKVIFAQKGNVEIIQEAAKLENVAVTIVAFEQHSSVLSIDRIMDEESTEEVKNFEVSKIGSDENDLAVLLFSSGTTGLPKGVMHSYRSLLRYTMAYNCMIGLGNTSPANSLWYSQLCWTSGLSNLLMTILKNDTRIIHSEFNAERTCQVIEEYRVNWVFLPPSALVQLQKSNVLTKHQLPSLKASLSGGSKIHKDVIEYLKRTLVHTRVYQGYGLTETGMMCAMQNESTANADSIGVVGTSYEIKITNEDTGDALGPNEQGEICIKTADVMLGYYKNPQATREMIDQDGWVHSGDKGYYNERGELFITDRIKEIMKFRGHHLSPSEIEDVLITHPDVHLVAVVPVPHALDIERPMAFVKKAPGSALKEEDLVKMTVELGPHKTLVGGVQFLEEFPFTASGKISRKELKEMAKTYAE